MNENEDHNLNEILEVVLMKYEEDFSRKSRIEAKMVGIITFLSLLFVVSISVFLNFYNFETVSSNIIFLSLLLSLFSQFYFMVLSIAMSIIGYKTRNTCIIKINDLFEKWKSEKKEFLGSVTKTLNEASNMNNNVNEKLTFYYDLSRLFLIINFISFIIFMLLSFYVFIGGIYVK